MNRAAAFKEVQRFTQAWIWAVLVLTSVVPTWILIHYVATGRVLG